MVLNQNEIDRTIENETTKLVAASLDRMSTACFTIGFAVPTFSALSGSVEGHNNPLFGLFLIVAFGGWVGLHFAARSQLKKLK